MPGRPNPTADLARMYRERIPTAPLSNTDKIIQSRLAPHRFTGESSGLGFLAPVGNFLKTAVESLDPRFIASEGGRSVEHVYGDATELAKSVVTGEDTLSQSPSARAYQAAGGGFGGALAAALPYVNVATAVVPTTKLLTPAGRVAMGADAIERVAQRQLEQAISRATPTVRSATADATERLAQSMATPALAERPTIYMNPFVYDPTPSQAPQPTIGINEIDDILSDIRASRPEAPSTQLAGVVEPSGSGLPRGVYAVDDANGNVTIYQLDDQGAVKGKLMMLRTADGFKVGLLSADPGSTTAANLLAAAKITGELNFPGVQYPLQPSSDLSQFSRPLVQKLQAAGLVDPNYTLPPLDILNDIDRPFDLNEPIPVQDVPRLVGVPPEQLREVTRDLIRALAQAKREGRISPDTIETTAKLRADLAARQAHAARQSSANNGFGFWYDPRPERTYGIPDSSSVPILGDTAPELMTALRNSSDPMVQVLLDVSPAAELVAGTVRMFQLNPHRFADYVEALVTSLRERLGRSPQHAQVYSNLGVDEEVFANKQIYSTLWNIWNQYGGPAARAIINKLPPPNVM